MTRIRNIREIRLISGALASLHARKQEIGNWQYESQGGRWRDVQSDGNLVLYNNSKAVWHTQTHGHSGARLVVLDTGNVVIRGPGGKILWQAR